MHDHGQHSDSSNNIRTLYLVGTPNVGKSVIFTSLTNKYATASNYPGTTVEITSGHISTKLFSREKVRLVDTPGINSLVPLSEDEKVTRDILFRHEKERGEKPGVLLVIDAKNLRRGLILAEQLAFCKIPFLVVLNMMDEAEALGIEINIDRLHQLLGVPVIKTIAIQKEGIGQIISSIQNPLSESSLNLNIPAKFSPYMAQMEELVHPLMALSLFYADTSIRPFLSKTEIQKAEKLLAQSALNSHDFQSMWMTNANSLQSEVYTRDIPSSSGWLNLLGSLSIKPFSGVFILFFMVYLVYKFVGVLGAGIGVDFLENVVFNEYLIPWVTSLIDLFPFPELIRELLVGPFGLISMGITYAIAIILPIVVTFFIAFSFLEDSGYLPRMGALLNSFFKCMGLNGKAILPMVLGLGCDTMATMTARVMDTPKERVLVTLLLALGIPCSAQLGVIFAFGVFLPFGYMLAWALIIVLVLILVGYLASKVVPGETSMFLLELPPLRIPKITNLLRKTFIRSKWYLKEAVPIFLIGTFTLFIMDKTGAIPFLNELLKGITVNGLGLPAESARSLIMGFLRRDFGAAGFLQLYEAGLLSPRQVLVSLVVITLFVPCIANLLMIIKERGILTGMAIFFFVIPMAFLTGTVLNHVMSFLGL